MTTPEQFEALLDAPEGTRIEFKAATGGFHFEELVQYCVALANEGGGSMVFGVTDQRPRQVVGTRAFAEPGRTEAGLFEKLRQRISPVSGGDWTGTNGFFQHRRFFDSRSGSQGAAAAGPSQRKVQVSFGTRHP